MDYTRILTKTSRQVILDNSNTKDEYMGKGISGHETPIKGATDSWITPKHIIDALGPFDLDPCQCSPQPWPCARRGYTIEDNGLLQPWYGHVWLNPPYSEAGPWLSKLSLHGDGIALIFARVETRVFREFVWGRATSLLFPYGRLSFHTPEGGKKGNSGGPSVLVAYGEECSARLKRSNIPGAFVCDWGV